jgi:predicted neutral ceramidase superfamily lipid hydrolase
MMWFSFVFLLALSGALLFVALPRAWKMTREQGAQVMAQIVAVTPLPSTLVRAGVRAVAVVYVPFAICVLTAAVAYWLKGGKKVPVRSPLFSTFINASGIAFVTMVVGYVAVLLFNRPRILVPPAFRSDKGFLASLRSK